MSNHERFRQLSALAVIGQLSAEEEWELSEHLEECRECRDAHGEYSYLIGYQLPRVNRIRWRTRLFMPLPDTELRDRFLARARAAGINLSKYAERSDAQVSFSSGEWRWQWRHVLALVALAVLGFGGTWASRKYQIVPRASAVESAKEKRENEKLRTELMTIQEAMETKAVELSEVRRADSLSNASFQDLRRHLNEAQKRVTTLSSQLKQATSEEARFAGENKDNEDLIAELRAQKDTLNRQIADGLRASVVQEARIRDMAESFERKTEDLERERQLTAVSNDVRQIMGARNLHVIDVREVDGGIDAAKPFGRIFYSEGQSLIFYAFELPRGRLPTQYTFQAWGDNGVRSHKLGIFKVDAHEQHRWVLKVSDPALLAGLDSVFVTVDTQIDGREPHGKKLLYAYVGGRPNYP
jgi:hypothetical protein